MTLSFPFTIAESGLSVRSKTLKSQIKMLLNCRRGTRLHDPNYGFNELDLEQELLQDFSPERTLFVIMLQEQFARYIPEVIITDVQFETPTGEYLVVNLFYADVNSQKDVVVWQPNIRLT